MHSHKITDFPSDNRAERNRPGSTSKNYFHPPLPKIITQNQRARAAPAHTSGRCHRSHLRSGSASRPAQEWQPPGLRYTYPGAGFSGSEWSSSVFQTIGGSLRPSAATTSVAPAAEQQKAIPAGKTPTGLQRGAKTYNRSNDRSTRFFFLLNRRRAFAL